MTEERIYFVACCYHPAAVDFWPHTIFDDRAKAEKFLEAGAKNAWVIREWTAAEAICAIEVMDATALKTASDWVRYFRVLTMNCHQ